MSVKILKNQIQLNLAQTGCLLVSKPSHELEFCFFSRTTAKAHWQLETISCEYLYCCNLTRVVEVNGVNVIGY